MQEPTPILYEYINQGSVVATDLLKLKKDDPTCTGVI